LKALYLVSVAGVMCWVNPLDFTLEVEFSPRTHN
jgi:hypothetical protein